MLAVQKSAMCQGLSDQHTDPAGIRLLKDNQLDKAGKLLFENNPLTTVCSLVCNHEKQCEGHCVLGKKGVPVHFSSIEQYVSRTYAPKMVKGPAEWNGMRVAIIGLGSEGLTIAIILARYGYQVTIFENKSEIGGVLRYGIPDFRLPKTVLDDIQYRHNPKVDFISIFSPASAKTPCRGSFYEKSIDNSTKIDYNTVMQLWLIIFLRYFQSGGCYGFKNGKNAGADQGSLFEAARKADAREDQGQGYLRDGNDQ